jgi:hypothetical protein
MQLPFSGMRCSTWWAPISRPPRLRHKAHAGRCLPGTEARLHRRYANDTLLQCAPFVLVLSAPTDLAPRSAAAPTSFANAA